MFPLRRPMKEGPFTVGTFGPPRSSGSSTQLREVLCHLRNFGSSNEEDSFFENSLVRDAVPRLVHFLSTSVPTSFLSVSYERILCLRFGKGLPNCWGFGYPCKKGQRVGLVETDRLGHRLGT